MIRTIAKIFKPYMWAITVLIVVLVALPQILQRMGSVSEMTIKIKELELKVVARTIKDEEKRYQDGVKTWPKVHLTMIIDGVEKNARAKLNLLITDFYDVEYSLVSKGGALADRIISARGLDDRLRHYKDDHSGEAVALRQLSDRIERQRSLLGHLSKGSFIATLRSARDAASRQESDELVKSALNEIASDRSIGQNGSAYNLLGNLAFALDEKELVFKYLYEAYLYEGEHLPTLESLSYALWKLNGDCLTSLKYAEEGAKLAWSQLNDFKRKRKDIPELFSSLKSKQPALASAVDGRSTEVSRFFSEHEQEITKYLNNEHDYLQNTAAYCMAFERIQENEARHIADYLLKSYPNDPDYMDTKGFVLMRFYRNSDEVQEAARLFDNSSAGSKDPHQKELAEHHRALADKLKRTLHL